MSDFKAKMHQIQFRLGSTPYPDGEAYSATPTDPLAGFKGITSKGEEKGGSGWGRDPLYFFLQIYVNGSC